MLRPSPTMPSPSAVNQGSGGNMEIFHVWIPACDSGIGLHNFKAAVGGGGGGDDDD